MRSHQADLRIESNGSGGLVDLTDRVQEAVEAAAILHGRATVTGGDADCALVVNEKETGLLIDVKAAMKRLKTNGDIPSIGSGSIVLPIVEGKLRLGVWQRILLIELNGSVAARSVTVQVIGE
jgi:thiamine phosphate synthase YjbQ (UPF0047 family)